VEQFTVRVGFSTVRPIVPDQHFHWVVIATDRGPNDAQLAAAQMVAGRGEMPTSTKIVHVEI